MVRAAQISATHHVCGCDAVALDKTHDSSGAAEASRHGCISHQLRLRCLDCLLQHRARGLGEAIVRCGEDELGHTLAKVCGHNVARIAMAVEHAQQLQTRARTEGAA